MNTETPHHEKLILLDKDVAALRTIQFDGTRLINGTHIGFNTNRLSSANDRSPANMTYEEAIDEVRRMQRDVKRSLTEKLTWKRRRSYTDLLKYLEELERRWLNDLDE